MNIALPIKLDQWRETAEGLATISYSAEKESVIVTAADGEKAFIYWPIPCNPGDVYEMSCIARVISGTAGALVGDYPNGTQLDRVVFDSQEWKAYNIIISTPTSGDVTNGILIGEFAIGLGVGTVGAGSVEIARPQLRLVKGSGGLRCFASAVIGVDQSNTVTPLSSFINFGIGDCTFLNGVITVNLTSPIDTSRGTYQLRHRMMPSITTTADGWDNASGPIHFAPKGIIDDTGAFTVVGYDSDGVLVTSYAGKSNRYFKVELWG